MPRHLLVVIVEGGFVSVGADEDHLHLVALV